MTAFEVGDVVTVEFPFSDFQQLKKRPGLVLAIDESDALLARITTRPPRETGDIFLENWDAAGLPKPSTVRLTKLVTIDRRLVLRRVGCLSAPDRSSIVQGLGGWLQALRAEFDKR